MYCYTPLPLTCKFESLAAVVMEFGEQVGSRRVSAITDRLLAATPAGSEETIACNSSRGHKRCPAATLGLAVFIAVFMLMISVELAGGVFWITSHVSWTCAVAASANKSIDCTMRLYADFWPVYQLVQMFTAIVSVAFFFAVQHTKAFAELPCSGTAVFIFVSGFACPSMWWYSIYWLPCMRDSAQTLSRRLFYFHSVNITLALAALLVEVCVVAKSGNTQSQFAVGHAGVYFWIAVGTFCAQTTILAIMAGCFRRAVSWLLAGDPLTIQCCRRPKTHAAVADERRAVATLLVGVFSVPALLLSWIYAVPFLRSTTPCSRGRCRNGLVVSCFVLTMVAFCASQTIFIFTSTSPELWLLMRSCVVGPAIFVAIVGWCLKKLFTLDGDQPQTNMSLLRWDKTADGRPARVLGQGAQAVVFEGKLLHSLNGRDPVDVDSATRTVAVKQVPTHCVNEMEHRLLVIEHTNVLRYFHVETTGATTYIAMELCDETLSTRLSRAPLLSPTDRRRLCIELFKGVSEIHGRDIVHRDIKPSNVLLKGGVAKIADFGLAAVCSPDRLSGAPSLIGTAAFQAPELLAPETLPGVETAVRPMAADVFSLGIVVHMVLTGFHPFGCCPDAVTIHDDNAACMRDNAFLIPARIVHGTPQLLLGPSERNAQKLLGAMLQKDPSNRPPHAQRCIMDFSPFFEEQRTTQPCSVLVGFVRDYVGYAFSGRQGVDPAAKQERLRLAQVLEYLLQKELQQDHAASTVETATSDPTAPATTGGGRMPRERRALSLDWSVRLGNRGWANDPQKLFNKWNGKHFPGFGLIVFVRNVFLHAGQLVPGVFSTYLELEAYIEERFPWLHQIAFEFCNTHLAEALSPTTPSNAAEERGHATEQQFPDT